MIRFIRCLLGLHAPFCRRWGHDVILCPWRHTPGCSVTYICNDPDCYWMCNFLPSPEYQRTGESYMRVPGSADHE